MRSRSGRCRRSGRPLAYDPLADIYEGAGVASTALRHLLADRQGSIVGAADSAGAILARNTYDEYGIPKSSDPALPVYGRFAYTGQIWLPELGMYHYKARLYSPTLGRFLQTDPVGYKDQINLYAYVGNDAVNFSDPSGQCQVGPDGKQIGVCGRGAAASAFLDSRMKDPTSKIAATDRLAASKGVLVSYGYGSEAPIKTPDGKRIEVRGANTVPVNGGKTLVVTVDTNESVRVPGVDTKTNLPSERTLTQREVAEHEITGHAAARISKGMGQENSPSTVPEALKAENDFRNANNIPFERVNETEGTVLPEPLPE